MFHTKKARNATALLAGALIGMSALAATPDGAQAIRKGQDARPNTHPQVAALRISGTKHPFCSGTLIRKDWVLTAAHCIDGDVVSKTLDIRLGATDLDAPTFQGESHTVDRRIIHRDWNGDQSDGHDVALLHLTNNSNILPAKLGMPEQLEDEKAPALALGWGRACDSCRTSLRLQQKLGKIKDLDDGLWEAQTSVCKGDSGGPLFVEQGGRDHRRYLVGVASFLLHGWGHGDWCDTDGDDYYADVTTGSELYTWISMNAQPRTPSGGTQGPACNPTKPTCQEPPA